MKKFLLTLPLMFGAAALFAQAQDDAARIQDAIRRLGAEKDEDRKSAAAELRRIGAPALDALRKAAAADGDVEVRAAAKQLVQELEKPATPPAPRPPDRAPLKNARPGSVSVKIVNGDAVYTIAPAAGDSITFHKNADGTVKLAYTDDAGARRNVESETLDRFVQDHKDLAAKFGISAEGIDYGGMRTSFNSRVKIQQIQPRRFQEESDPLPDSVEEELRRIMEQLQQDLPGGVPRMFEWPVDGMFGAAMVRGARLTAVPEVLRAQLSIPDGQGVVVDGVREGSTAAVVGLKRHDVILDIDGKKISSSKDVSAALNRGSAVKILRAGKETSIKGPGEPEKSEKEKSDKKDY